MENVCIFCKHWRFDSGEAWYSDLTPGTNWDSSCHKGKWECYGSNISEEDYRGHLLTAKNCELFEDINAQE